MDTRGVDGLVADLAEQQHGIFTVGQLESLGLSRRQRQLRLRRGVWDSPYDGVYRVRGTPTSWRQDLLAACWASGAVASHRSAAALWDLPGSRRDRVEVTCERWRRAQHAMLIVHETMLLTDADVTSSDGIPTTTVERTLFDLGARVTRTTLDLAIDQALRRDLTSVARLTETLFRVAKRGRPGSAAFRHVLATRRADQPLAESPAERRLARALVDQGLPEPTVQYEVRDLDGRVVARCDLAYPRWRIVIEYDSIQEHVGKAALLRDSARRNTVAALGYVPLTATVADLRDRGARLASIVRQIRAQVA